VGSDYQVATHKVKGRIVSIEKKLLVDVWKLTLFSDGEVYEIDVENAKSVKELRQYNKKYIIVDYVEYLFRGPIRLKHQFKSWETTKETKLVKGLNIKLLKYVDKHLTCTLISQLDNNVELKEQVFDYLEKSDFDLKNISEICHI
jgi:hypothetical protein